MNEQLIGNEAINEVVLQPKTGGAVAPPFARERLIVETGNLPQTEGSRNWGDVFPLLVPFQDLLGRDCALFVNATMFDWMDGTSVRDQLLEFRY